MVNIPPIKMVNLGVVLYCFTNMTIIVNGLRWASKKMEMRRIWFDFKMEMSRKHGKLVCLKMGLCPQSCSSTPSDLQWSTHVLVRHWCHCHGTSAKSKKKHMYVIIYIYIIYIIFLYIIYYIMINVVVPPSALVTLVIVCFLLTPVRSTLVTHGDSPSQGVTVILKSSGPRFPAPP